jgi:hypothetical protein
MDIWAHTGCHDRWQTATSRSLSARACQSTTLRAPASNTRRQFSRRHIGVRALHNSLDAECRRPGVEGAERGAAVCWEGPHELEPAGIIACQAGTRAAVAEADYRAGGTCTLRRKLSGPHLLRRACGVRVSGTQRTRGGGGGKGVESDRTGCGTQSSCCKRAAQLTAGVLRRCRVCARATFAQRQADRGTSLSQPRMRQACSGPRRRPASLSPSS